MSRIVESLYRITEAVIDTDDIKTIEDFGYELQDYFNNLSNSYRMEFIYRNTEFEDCHIVIYDSYTNKIVYEFPIRSRLKTIKIPNFYCVSNNTNIDLGDGLDLEYAMSKLTDSLKTK